MDPILIQFFKAAVPERFKRVIKALKAQHPRSYSSPGIKAGEAEGLNDKNGGGQ